MSSALPGPRVVPRTCHPAWTRRLPSSRPRHPQPTISALARLGPVSRSTSPRPELGSLDPQLVLEVREPLVVPASLALANRLVLLRHSRGIRPRQLALAAAA